MSSFVDGRSGFTLIVAGLLAACGRSSSVAPVIHLPAGHDTVSTRLSDVTEAVWLGKNRWAVISPSTEAVGIVDFSGRLFQPLGASNPKELRNPTTLFAAGDTLYVGDWGSRRTTLWAPAGRPVRSIPAPDIVRGALPRARDSNGSLYLDLYPRPGLDGSGNRDSAAVLRLDPALSRADTVARLAPLDIAEVVSDAGRRFERRVFGGLDRWGVLPDGSLWVARVYQNRVDWRSPEGKWTRGQGLPDRVLEVTRYDRELFLRKFPPELRSTAQQLPFAPIKPPFEAGFADGEGRVWLEKSRAPADSSRRYHVVDRNGRLTREIRLPGQGRIFAVGGRSALVGEVVPGGTRFMQVPLPAPPRTP